MLRLTDEDKDSVVTRDDLRNLEIKANEWSVQKKVSAPDKLSDICDIVFECFDREELRNEYNLKSNAKDELKLIRNTLQVGGCG